MFGGARIFDQDISEWALAFGHRQGQPLNAAGMFDRGSALSSCNKAAIKAAWQQYNATVVVGVEWAVDWPARCGRVEKCSMLQQLYHNGAVHTTEGHCEDTLWLDIGRCIPSVDTGGVARILRTHTPERLSIRRPTNGNGRRTCTRLRQYGRVMAGVMRGFLPTQT